MNKALGKNFDKYTKKDLSITIKHLYRENMFKFIKNLSYLFFGKPDASYDHIKNETIGLIMNRRSCRTFTNEEVDEESIKTILEAGRFAPSTVNLQTWSFITYSKHEWKECFGHSIPFKGAFAIIICADMFKIKDFFPDFKETPYINNSFALFNAGLAAMNMTLAAEALGFRSVMLSETGGTGLLDIKTLKEKLNLPNHVLPITTLVIGKSGIKFPGIPPRQPKNTVTMRKLYNLNAGANLKEWFGQMTAGYKVTHPLSTLDKQIEFYRMKMTNAEKEVRKVFDPDFNNN